MGADMVELPAQTPMEEDLEYLLPAFILPGVVVMPDQLVPLMLMAPHHIYAVQAILRAPNKVVALIPAVSGPLQSLDLCQYGTTAEIVCHGPCNDHMPCYRLKVRARQRFRVIRCWSDEHKSVPNSFVVH